MNLDLFSLNGKSSLITGAAGLLGKQHALAVLKAGGKVVLTDINEERLKSLCHELEQQYPKHVIYEVMDVTNEQSVKYVSEQLTKKDIPIDILINNAARNPAVNQKSGLSHTDRLENLDFTELHRDIEIGLIGATLCAKVFGSEMAKQGRGSIINVSSDLGVIAPDQRLYIDENKPPECQSVKPVSYSLVKHGIIGLTKYLATYWAHKGVRCNSISPGGVQASQNEIFLQRITKLIPLGRMAKIDELQGVIIFLASNASSYVNGANIVIDGGRSVW